MFACKPGEEEDFFMDMKIGLRYLRTYPDHMGLILIDGKICSLEVKWRDGDLKDERCVRQDDLLLAVLKGRRGSHIVFW